MRSGCGGSHGIAVAVGIESGDCAVIGNVGVGVVGVVILNIEECEVVHIDRIRNDNELAVRWCIAGCILQEDAPSNGGEDRSIWEEVV